MFFNMFKKELKEVLTIGSIISIAAMSFVFAMIGQSVGNIEEKLEVKPAIGLINNDNGIFGIISTQILQETSDIIYNGSDKSAGLQEVIAEKGIALIEIPSDFSDSIYNNEQGKLNINWVVQGVGPFDGISSDVLDYVLNAVEKEISKIIITQELDLDPNLILNPLTTSQTTFLKEKEFRGLSPNELINTFSTQSYLIPTLIMMIIMMSGSSIISSMGLEKENKTLETLLTLPVKRNYIILSKIIASTISGLILAAIYMVGMTYYMKSFSFSGVVDLQAYNLTLNIYDYTLMGLSVFMSLLAGLSLCLALGSFAKDYKSAQSLLFPVTVLAVFSMLMTMFMDFSTMPTFIKIFIFIIPFSHPMMAMKSLMLKEYALVISGIIYSSIFAAIMIIITILIFNSDRLLVGKLQKNKKSAKNLVS
ncbi:ABC transporter permease [Defluviitoga tunisiensis]|jgi:ABC-2 type transport system permease protein|uniref:ABC-type Na+ efflux pump n=1 Tax=Defluviitoga tunisiensis TaxID=1006576 RepID=A0A0C7NZG1_DEFTU|nr:ABC transporter permease [Defluviitoga tunisiensis]MDD3600777.1 ABC transporter permease [Defluviitoga tunisiensis]CEP77390.1 ABC-type Na+ efflux pump [Defluviitoga tunisiensis]